MVEAPEPEPGAGEIIVQAEAVGVNFADVWVRLGADGEPPYAPGIEVAGKIMAVGDAVRDTRCVRGTRPRARGPRLPHPGPARERRGCGAAPELPDRVRRGRAG